MRDLLLWLRANRRTDATFKLGNQTHIELALHNLFAFWPKLKVSVTDPRHGFNSDHYVSSDDEEEDIRISTRLFWPHRHKVHTLLREPHKFIPNMNAL